MKNYLKHLKKKLLLENPPRMQDYINRGAAVAEHDTRDSLHKINTFSRIEIFTSKNSQLKIRNY